MMLIMLIMLMIIHFGGGGLIVGLAAGRLPGVESGKAGGFAKQVQMESRCRWKAGADGKQVQLESRWILLNEWPFFGSPYYAYASANEKKFL